LLLCSAAGVLCWLLTLIVLRHPVCEEFWGIAHTILDRIGLRKRDSGESSQTV
jgi:hypothetical protein